MLVYCWLLAACDVSILMIVTRYWCQTGNNKGAKLLQHYTMSWLLHTYTLSVSASSTPTWSLTHHNDVDIWINNIKTTAQNNSCLETAETLKGWECYIGDCTIHTIWKIYWSTNDKQLNIFFKKSYIIHDNNYQLSNYV